MKKREIVLILLLIAFGFFYQAIEKGKIRFQHDFSYYANENRLAGSQFVEFSEKERIFDAVDRIVIENPAGEININDSNDGRVHLLSFFRVYYSDKKDVGDIQGRTSIHSELNGRELGISGRYASGFPYRRLRIQLELRVPGNVALAINNHEGNVSIRNTGKDIRLLQENGNLVAENIPSGMKIELKNGNAKIRDIAGPVELDVSRANVVLKNVLSLRMRGRHGEHSLTKITNKATIEQAYGKLVLADAAEAEINARHCRVIARDIRNSMILSNEYENTTLENIGGDIRVSSRLSRMDLIHVMGNNVVIENFFADINITDYSGKNLDILLKNGNLNLQVKNAENRINIDAKNAELILAFAAMADPTFNIKTTHGRIYDQLPVVLEKYDEAAESFANRSGQKPEILISNTYGDIHLKNTI